MKSCPKCNRTFPDEGQKFCTFDGGLLIAPQTFDPNATIRATSIDLNAASERPTSRDLPDPNATIIESYIGAAGETYFSNAVSEFFVGENGGVDHYKVQEESIEAFQDVVNACRVEIWRHQRKEFRERATLDTDGTSAPTTGTQPYPRPSG